jgi:Putative zinc-finger
MKCAEAKPMLSPYLDTAMTGKEMNAVSDHLASCAECRTEVALLTTTQKLLSDLGRKQAPPELSLQLRVMVSQAVAQRRRNSLEALALRWNNVVKAFMVPAMAGMVSAVIIFGLMLGMIMPMPLRAADDIPTGLYTPPELTSSAFGYDPGQAADAVVVEAYIDATGRVQEFRMLQGPTELSPQLKNMLLFTQFRPATSFGLPTSGRAILTFTGINVRG